jgi:hypothetical protein
LVRGREIYPYLPSLATKNFWYCDNSHDPAYVGCHPGTRKPLGTLADTFTRYWRSKAHQAFDPLWKHSSLTRTQAYAKLAKQLEISLPECHIGLFDAKMCKRVVEATHNLKGHMNEQLRFQYLETKRKDY